jgi:hypothetical protein
MHRLLRWTTRPESAALLIAVAVVMAPVLILAPGLFASTTAFGVQDWDFEASQRYLTKLSLLEYHQAPFWNPYACGGFPAWGTIEGATNLVSPWLPIYLAFPITLATRIEILGSGLLGAVGAWAATGRYTRSYAGKALVVALWAFNSRWALQASAGHAWHLLYAWMPWCLYFFERTGEESHRFRHTAALAMCFAVLVYGGAIYPLPHVVLALLLYAGALAAAERSVGPLKRLFLPGILGAALAAPKLLPMLHELPRMPRLIESNETVTGHTVWAALTAGVQTIRVKEFRNLDYKWLEYGIYVSVVGVVILLAALLVTGRRENALKAVGAIFVVLGLGSFAGVAPWRLLHDHAPFFASQHVPTRFWYPALLLLSLVAASGLGRLTTRGRWLDPIAAALVLLLGVHIAIVSNQSLGEAMRLKAPPIVAGETFHHEQVAPFHYFPADWAPPMYLAMLGNRGVIACYGLPPLDRVGARSVTDPQYSGEVTVTPDGTARIAAWSPNRVVLAVEVPSAASTVVYNMNYDDGWTSDEGAVIDVDGRVGITVSRLSPSVTLTYWPPLLAPGLMLGFGAALIMLVLWRRERPILRNPAA